MRPPVETQMKRISRCGQLRRTSAIRPFIWRVIYMPSRAAIDVAEGEAGIGDSRIVENWYEARRIGHNRAIEQGLIPIGQADKINVSLKVV